MLETIQFRSTDHPKIRLQPTNNNSMAMDEPFNIDLMMIRERERVLMIYKPHDVTKAAWSHLS